MSRAATATIVKKVARKKKIPKKEISDTEITKSIIEDFILNCETDGITIEVLQKLHAVWLPKLKECIPDLYQSTNTEWNKILKRRKEIEQLSLQREKDSQSSEKENLDIIIGNEFKRIAGTSSNLKKNQHVKTIGSSMPVLDDDIDVSCTFDQLGAPIVKNTENIFCSTGKAPKCSVKTGNLALNVEHNFNKTALNDKRIFAHISNNELKGFSQLEQNELNTKFQDVINFDSCKSKKEKSHKYTPKNVDMSDWKRNFYGNSSQTTSDNPKSDTYLQFVTHAGLDHLIYGKKYDDQTFENENFHFDMDDIADEEYKSSFNESDESDHNILITEHLPMLSLKRKHSIKECQRRRRKKVDNEETGVINEICYQVIPQPLCLSKSFNFHVKVFLPNQDQDKEQRTCMLTVPSLLLKNLDLIINSLINKVNKFTESEATFVLQKSVDSAMKQIVASQMDGPISAKFRMVHNDKYNFRLLKEKNYYISDDDESINSIDNISDEDDVIAENNLNAECETSIYCCYKRIYKRASIFYIKLYNGIIRSNGQEDRYFKTLEGKVKFE